MPVVARQWAAISHFQEKLVNGALEALAASDITPVVCFAFLSFVPSLLELISSSRTLLDVDYLFIFSCHL